MDLCLHAVQWPADYILALCARTRVEAAALQGGAEEFRLQHEAAAPAHNVIAAVAPVAVEL